jgi:hypothetical protein
MHIQAVWPEVHDFVMNYGKGWVLNNDLELLGNVVGEWRVGDHTRQCADHGS